MRCATLLAALSLAECLGGCASSPPTQFYTLEVVPAQRRERQISHAPVQVAVVHVPPILDRQEIVRGTGSNTVIVSNRHRWAAPMGDMMRRVLTQDLLERLPANAIMLAEQPAPAQTSVLTVDILQFQSEASGQVVLDGSWSLVPAGTETPILSRRVHLTESAGPQDYAMQAKSMSRAVGQLADDIATALAEAAPRD
ncbi:MAG: PqiC family protein [Steroidobacteraceae bacterium]